MEGQKLLLKVPREINSDRRILIAIDSDEILTPLTSQNSLIEDLIYMALGN